jgi:hypothetical protein
MILLDAVSNYETKLVFPFGIIANEATTINEQAGDIIGAARVACRSAIRSGLTIKEEKQVKDGTGTVIKERKIRESDFRITIAIDYNDTDERILGELVSIPFAYTDGQKVRKAAIDFVEAMLAIPINKANNELRKHPFTDYLKIKEVNATTKDGKQVTRKVVDVPELADFRRFLDSPLSIALN